MPVMDGLEAARRIRAQACFADLPVVAMTAAVMPRDREACEAVGMNDHVAKPILLRNLRATLMKWIKPRARTATADSAPTRQLEPLVWLPVELPGFDVDNALALMEGNRALFRRLAIRFGEQFAGAADEMARRIAAGENTAAALAHQIKGAAGNLGATALQQSAAALENELHAAGTGDTLAQGMAAFRTALDEVVASATQLASQSPPVPLGAEYECDHCDCHNAAVLFGQLRTLVDNYEFVPHELFAGLKGSVACQPLRRQLDALARLVEATDYDGARKVLGEIACKQGYRLGAQGDG